MMLEFVSIFLLTLGCVVTFSAALGINRFPDICMRLHAATKATTGGALSILSGLALQTGISLTTAKLLILMVIIICLTPTISHAIARSAHIMGSIPATPFEIYPPKEYTYDTEHWRRERV